jgi:hypothetical protein
MYYIHKQLTKPPGGYYGYRMEKNRRNSKDDVAMRMVKKNQKRLMVMSVALFIICAMALGYAALSSSLKISGTGTISANWDILFTRIEEASKKGATSNESVITDKLTATFDVNIEAPGNFIEYNVTLKNNGNIDAVIESIGGIVEANGDLSLIHI